MRVLSKIAGVRIIDHVINAVTTEQLGQEGIVEK